MVTSDKPGEAVAEETDQEHGTAATDGVDPAAMALALSAAAQSERVATEAEVFLREQTRLTRAQLARIEAQDDHIEEEQRLQLSHMRLRRFSDYSKMALEIAVGAFLLVVVGAFGALVWDAHEARGLVVEPLHTPSEIAASGLDGTVLSRQLLDKLNALVAESDKWSVRAASTISGNWGDDSKVEIPETGISVGELSRSLHQWLGHETRVSGEIFRTGTGLAITVRSDSNPAITLFGSASDLNGLLSRAASALFRQTQPLRFITGTFNQPHTLAEIQSARRLAETGPPTEQLFAWSTVSEFQMSNGDIHNAETSATRQIEIEPSVFMGYADRNGARMALGHLEGALIDAKKSVELLDHGNVDDFNPNALAFLRPNMAGIYADAVGAFRDAVGFDLQQTQISMFDSDKTASAVVANDEALDHDPQAASIVLAAHPEWNDAFTVINLLSYGPIAPKFFLLAEQNHWREAADLLSKTDELAGKSGNANDVRHTFFWPLLAYAWSRSGNLKGAEELIAMTPHDCTRCLEMRGRIAEVAGNFSAAAYWFDRAVRDAPSVPFAVTDWGAMLLHKGDYDAAIAKFTLANQKGPHFADPLEMWGETLMLKNRSDLALAKFEDANKYAPNWGRLHMKWGEALGYVGSKDDARAQYRIASTLDLSVADKTELARDMRA